MRFQLTGPWPVDGGVTLPVGTVIEATKPTKGEEPTLLPHSGIRLFWPVPIQSKPLDQDAFDALHDYVARHYPDWLGRILKHDPEPKPVKPRRGK